MKNQIVLVLKVCLARLDLPIHLLLHLWHQNQEYNQLIITLLLLQDHPTHLHLPTPTHLLEQIITLLLLQGLPHLLQGMLDLHYPLALQRLPDLSLHYPLALQRLPELSLHYLLVGYLTLAPLQYLDVSDECQLEGMDWVQVLHDPPE